MQHLLFACAIAIAVLGGILMLGAQFLPGPRLSSSDSAASSSSSAHQFIKLLCLIFLAFVGVAALWAFAVG